MVARLRLTRTWPLLVALVLLLVFIVWRAGVLDPRSWVQGRSAGAYPFFTEKTLLSAAPLVVEGTLVAKGQGVTPGRGDNPLGIPYDRYELNVTHVWSGPEQTKSVTLAFPKSAGGVGVEDEVHVQAGAKYVFFLDPEPRQGGIWKGLHPLGNEQMIWKPLGDRIVPTASHFKEMTRTEFAAFIAAQAERPQQPAVLAEG
jgi:hypothetical protein